MSDLEMAVKHMAQHIADRSNPAGPAAASGATEIRRLAAERAVNDGNKRSNILRTFDRATKDMEAQLDSTCK